MMNKQDNIIKEFNKVSNEIDELYHLLANKIGLSDSAYEIINALLTYGEGITQTYIYKNSYLNKQTVNSSIKQLQKNEIIYFKEKTGKENKIYFTDKGEKLVKEKVFPIEKIEESVLIEMTEDECVLLVSLMKKYLKIYKEKIDEYLKKGE